MANLNTPKITKAPAAKEAGSVAASVPAVASAPAPKAAPAAPKAPRKQLSHREKLALQVTRLAKAAGRVANYATRLRDGENKLEGAIPRTTELMTLVADIVNAEKLVPATISFARTQGKGAPKFTPEIGKEYQLTAANKKLIESKRVQVGQIVRIDDIVECDDDNTMLKVTRVADGASFKLLGKGKVEPVGQTHTGPRGPRKPKTDGEAAPAAKA